MQLLCLWRAKSDLQEVIASKHDFAAVASQVRRLVQSCAPLKSMLASAWDQVARSCWKDDIIQKISDLEHEDYEHDAMAGFRDCMTLTAKAMMQKGNQKYKKFMVSFDFGGRCLELEVTSPSEQWQLHLSCRMQQVGLQSGRLPLLPWEDLFWSKGSFQGVPEHCRLPDSLLDPIRSAREFILEHVDTSMTINEMIIAIRSKEKAALKTDAGFKINVHMLRMYVQEWTEQAVTARALEAMPSETEPEITMTSAIFVFLSFSSAQFFQLFKK